MLAVNGVSIEFKLGSRARSESLRSISLISLGRTAVLFDVFKADSEPVRVGLSSSSENLHGLRLFDLLLARIRWYCSYSNSSGTLGRRSVRSSLHIGELFAEPPAGLSRSKCTFLGDDVPEPCNECRCD